MNNDIEFKTQEELYNRVLPALTSKVSELYRQRVKHISERQIWNYLVENEWKNKKDLELHNLVSDILYVNSQKLNDYVSNKISEINSDGSLL